MENGNVKMMECSVRENCVSDGDSKTGLGCNLGARCQQLISREYGGLLAANFLWIFPRKEEG